MEIKGSGKAAIAFCCNGIGSAHAVRCMSGSYVPISMQLKQVNGSVRFSIDGFGEAALSIKTSSANEGFIKRAVRASGRSKVNLKSRVRGIATVKSFISSSTSKQAIKLAGKSEVGNVLTPIYSTTNLKILISHWSSFVPEISQPVFSQCTMNKFNNQEHIEIQVLKEYLGSDEFRGDRRNWMVAKVLFKNVPVMYLLNMGWPGVYSPMKFLLDTHCYQHLIHYLFSMIKPDPGGENTYRYSLDGTVLDRVRQLQPEPLVDISKLPISIKELINIYGDYDPAIRNRVYGVNQ